MKKINYLDETDQEYAKALKKVDTLDSLKALMIEYDELVEDATELVNKMSLQDFQAFVKNRNKENKGIYSGDETTAVIMMPEKMMEVSMKAIQFKVPFGTAYIRLKEAL